MKISKKIKHKYRIDERRIKIRMLPIRLKNEPRERGDSVGCKSDAADFIRKTISAVYTETLFTYE